MTATEPALDVTRWTAICPSSRLTPDRGVAALVDGEAVAVFLLSDGSTYAIGNVDPFSGASVLSRGIVGDADGRPTVASPIYKQRFDLRTGRSLDDESVAVRTYDVRLVDGTCELRPGNPRP
jgi:nitrite reductase (NADH) small subunit